MTLSLRDIDISKLSVPQRIQIAHDLLDSVLAETQGEFFTPDQLQEIRSRVAASDAGDVVGEPWDDVYAQLTKR